MSASGLSLEHVTLSIEARRLVDDLSLRVAPGAATSIMGPSGSGKSALLAFVGGHLDPAFPRAAASRSTAST